MCNGASECEECGLEHCGASVYRERWTWVLSPRNSETSQTHKGSGDAVPENKVFTDRQKNLR